MRGVHVVLPFEPTASSFLVLCQAQAPELVHMHATGLASRLLAAMAVVKELAASAFPAANGGHAARRSWNAYLCKPAV